MKKIIYSMFLCSSVLGLAACSTSGLGDFDDAPPYADERTATHEQVIKTAPPAPAPAPAPVVQECPKPDTSALESRIANLEAELAQCREASKRVRAEFRDDLRK